jgi:hypothetical protein
MKYNVLKNSLCDVNTSEGNKNLNFYEKSKLFNDDYTAITTLSSDDILVLDFDFGHRISLDRFEYKFDSGGYDPHLVASGIKFYYKNESFDDFKTLDTYVYDNNTYFSKIVGELFAPRFVRFKHCIAETYGNQDISGEVLGLRAINNDSIVDFGGDGTQIEDYIDVTRTYNPVIREVKIFNSGENRATAYVNLEPTGTSFDDVVSMSLSQSGPWVGINDSDNLIADSSNFNSGVFESTQFSTGVLTLFRQNDINGDFFYLSSDGDYKSKIFVVDDIYSRIRLDVVEDQIPYNVSIDKGDPNETIEIRSSSSCPKPHAVIRELRGLTNNVNNLGYRDTWLETKALKEDSVWSFLSCSSYSNWRDYGVKYDQLTERWFGFCVHWGTTTYYTNKSQLILFNNVGKNANTYILSTHSENGTAITYEWIDHKCDHTGGIWVYFYCMSYSSGAFVHSTGYYLAYFDSSLSVVFKWYSVYRDISSFDVDYEGRFVWYNRATSSAIYKIAYDGKIEVNFIHLEHTNNLGGIVVLKDGGVLFSNGKDIHRLKYNGLFLPEYSLRNVTNEKITHMAIDNNDYNAIWVIFGMSVGKLYVFGERAGEFDFSIILDRPSSLEVLDDGVWVRCSDISSGSIVMNYISKKDRKVTMSHFPSGNSLPGILYQSFDNPLYAKKLPVITDNVWSELVWKKVSTDGYLSSEDKYYQVRLKFIGQAPIEKYPEFVSDVNQKYISYDNFNQLSSTPNQLLWGNWRDKPELNRVYVKTESSKLSLIQVPSTNVNSFINTSKRMLVGRNNDGLLDVRIKYKIGSGNGVSSGKLENLYLYLYNPSVSSNFPYILTRLYIPNDTSSSRIYVGSSTGSSNFANLGSYINHYEGELRIYWNGSTLYGQRRSEGGSFSGSSISANEGVVGKYFYCEILCDRNGSNVEIDEFSVFQGHTYHYSGSKKVRSIYKQKSIEIKDIYPNNYKSIYVKVQVPINSDVSDYGSVDMKVRWKVPV